MEELESAVDSASKGDYSGLTQIQAALQDPTYYLAFSSVLLDSLQSKDIFVFHGLNLLVTAGITKASLYHTLKAYVPRLLDAGRTLLATGIAVKTLSKLVALVVPACFSSDEMHTFCTMLIDERFTEVPFLLSVVEDLLFHIATASVAKQVVAQDTVIRESVIRLVNQVIDSLDLLMDAYFTPSTVPTFNKGNYQAFILAHLKIVTISVKWGALSKTCSAFPTNSDDAFFDTQAKPLPELLDLLETAWYNRSAKLFLLALLRKDELVYSCCQELFFALATVTYSKAKSSSIICMFVIALLARFYQFQLSRVDGEGIVSKLEMATLELDLSTCISECRPSEHNPIVVAGNFFCSNAWLNIPHSPEDDFFPLQIIQSLILANGPVTMLSILNRNQLTRLLCQFSFTIFFVHMTVSQELGFTVSYLSSLMSIVHASYQACIIGPSLNLVSSGNAQNSSLVLTLNSFLLLIYCRTSAPLYISQIQMHMANCLDMLVNKEPTPRNMRQHNVQKCSSNCVQLIRDFSINLHTAVRYCFMPENNDPARFSFVRFCQESAIFERIRDGVALPLTDPAKLDSNLAIVVFNSVLFFGIRDEIFSFNEEEFVGAQPVYLCMAPTEMLISQQCRLASTAICLIARGLSGECDWSSVIRACFYTQIAIQWAQYMLYDSECATSYSECLSAASRAAISEAILTVLKCMGSIHDPPGHVHLSTLFLNDAIISTLLSCIDAMNIVRKRPAFPLDVVLRAVKRLDAMCREVPVASTCDFINFLLKCKTNILTFSSLLIEHVRPDETLHLTTYIDSLLSTVATAGSQELTTNPCLVIEVLTLLLSASAGGLAALENLSINDCAGLKTAFLDKIFAAYDMVLPYLEALPNGTNYILSAMFLVRDIFLFAKITIDKWLKYIGPQVASFFERLVDSSFGLLCRSLQTTMDWASISSERCSSLRHVYSGEDVTSVAFSGHEQLYLVFLAASVITVDTLYEITNYIPSLLTLRGDDYKSFISHLFTNVLTIILSFTPILNHIDDNDITKMVDMITMILNLSNDTLEQGEATRMLTALCNFLDNLSPTHVSLKIKLFGCIATFVNALLSNYTHTDQLEQANQAYVQVTEKSIGRLIRCVFSSVQDEDLISDLAAALLHVVFVDIEDVSMTGLQFRQDVFRLQILEAVQALGVQDLTSLVNSAFSDMQSIAAEGSKGYNMITPIRALLFALHAICIKHAVTPGLPSM
ncbi:Hypothetical protein GLP15_1617 [Giardia lamblia P15]|uniref:Uncharacterized protein n=1 Tax=Giardia intestinalis (strain P15) TaxID=658858 RepID=E1F7Y7_GIAIA|nr:Hypothetical protein GLP15_1617 [Giardia lamblia P15]